ncbi:MAG: tRNA dihydrouridine synthase DusB [Limnochordia bacterium]|jgi:tRNA-dihydrouridine synthase B
MRWHIGGVEISNRVVLAPMAGVTDLSFRLLVKEFDCGLVYAPMVSSMALQYGNPATRKFVSISERERPVAIQLFGAKPSIMAEAARYVADLGPDIIDINMGCPTPKIVSGGAGCALMREPAQAAEVAAAVVKAVSIPVTAKMRSGWDAEHPTAVELSRRLEDVGVVALCVHGRTREQFYSGRADWSVIAAVKQAVSVPVIGNGDVRTPQDAARLLEVTGCDAVMVGRSSLGRPWVFTQIVQHLQGDEVMADPDPDERIALAVRHLHMAVDFGGERAIFEMRKHLAWYLKGLDHANQVKRAVMEAETFASVIDILQTYRRQLRECCGAAGELIE